MNGIKILKFITDEFNFSFETLDMRFSDVHSVRIALVKIKNVPMQY